MQFSSVSWASRDSKPEPFNFLQVWRKFGTRSGNRASYRTASPQGSENDDTGSELKLAVPIEIRAFAQHQV